MTPDLILENEQWRLAFFFFFPSYKENYHILNLYNKAFDVTGSHFASSRIGLGDPPWKVKGKGGRKEFSIQTNGTQENQKTKWGWEDCTKRRFCSNRGHSQEEKVEFCSIVSRFKTWAIGFSTFSPLLFIIFCAL